MHRRRERVESLLRNFEWTWTSAVLFATGLVFLIMISIAVIPSFFLYYADEELKWDGGAPHTLLPWSWAEGILPWVIPPFWLKLLRDAVTMGLSTVPLVALLVLGAVMQNWRRKLRGSSGDTRAAGGYR
jgi:hypothetical protein